MPTWHVVFEAWVDDCDTEQDAVAEAKILIAGDDFEPTEVREEDD